MNDDNTMWMYECGACGYLHYEQGEPVEDICPDCEEEMIIPVPAQDDHLAAEDADLRVKTVKEYR